MKAARRMTRGNYVMCLEPAAEWILRLAQPVSVHCNVGSERRSGPCVHDVRVRNQITRSALFTFSAPYQVSTLISWALPAKTRSSTFSNLNFTVYMSVVPFVSLVLLDLALALLVSGGGRPGSHEGI